MRSTVLVTAAVVCLAFVLYATSSPARAPSIPQVGAVTHRLTESTGLPRETTSHSASDAAAICIGEIPDKTKELTTLIKYLHFTTIQAFEKSPKFGGQRGGFGGGQFGSRSIKTEVVMKPSLHFREHPPFTKQSDKKDRSLFTGIPSTKAFDPQWAWLEELHGVTGRGFVYKLGDRHVVGMPVQSTLERFIDHVVSTDPSTDLRDHERVWEVVELQLIGLFMHAHPVAYDKHLMVNESEQSPKTRTLDEFETESLESLRAGAERVAAWNVEENCLQVLGAIRAKESCMKCHDVNAGHLLGAFSYRIKEATSQ